MQFWSAWHVFFYAVERKCPPSASVLLIPYPRNSCIWVGNGGFAVTWLGISCNLLALASFALGICLRINLLVYLHSANPVRVFVCGLSFSNWRNPWFVFIFISYFPWMKIQSWLCDGATTPLSKVSWLVFSLHPTSECLDSAPSSGSCLQPPTGADHGHQWLWFTLLSSYHPCERPVLSFLLSALAPALLGIWGVWQ